MKTQYNFRELSDKQCSNCSNLLKAKNANKGFTLCYPCYNILNGKDKRVKMKGAEIIKTIHYKNKQGR